MHENSDSQKPTTGPFHAEEKMSATTFKVLSRNAYYF
jgi:hypothetical protein